MWGQFRCPAPVRAGPPFASLFGKGTSFTFPPGLGRKDRDMRTASSAPCERAPAAPGTVRPALNSVFTPPASPRAQRNASPVPRVLHPGCLSSFLLLTTLVQASVTSPLRLGSLLASESVHDRFARSPPASDAPGLPGTSLRHPGHPHPALPQPPASPCAASTLLPEVEGQMWHDPGPWVSCQRFGQSLQHRDRSKAEHSLK